MVVLAALSACGPPPEDPATPGATTVATTSSAPMNCVELTFDAPDVPFNGKVHWGIGSLKIAKPLPVDPCNAQWSQATQSWVEWMGKCDSCSTDQVVIDFIAKGSSERLLGGTAEIPYSYVYPVGTQTSQRLRFSERVAKETVVYVCLEKANGTLTRQGVYMPPIEWKGRTSVSLNGFFRW